MKKLLVIALLIVLYKQSAFSQDYPSPFKFETIDSMQGTKSELFVKANEWVAKTFNSAKDVIQMSDKDAGKIIAKGMMESGGRVGFVKGTFYIKYTLSIDLKDNKCRIRISDFITVGCMSNAALIDSHYFDLNYSLDNQDPPDNYSMKTWNDIKYTCTYRSGELVKELIIALKSKSENW